jgi:hypothetical protein
MLFPYYIAVDSTPNREISKKSKKSKQNASSRDVGRPCIWPITQVLIVRYRSVALTVSHLLLRFDHSNHKTLKPRTYHRKIKISMYGRLATFTSMTVLYPGPVRPHNFEHNWLIWLIFLDIRTGERDLYNYMQVINIVKHQTQKRHIKGQKLQCMA